MMQSHAASENDVLYCYWHDHVYKVSERLGPEGRQRLFKSWLSTIDQNEVAYILVYFGKAVEA